MSIHLLVINWGEAKVKDLAHWFLCFRIQREILLKLHWLQNQLWHAAAAQKWVVSYHRYPWCLFAGTPLRLIHFIKHRLESRKKKKKDFWMAGMILWALKCDTCARVDLVRCLHELNRAGIGKGMPNKGISDMSETGQLVMNKYARLAPIKAWKHMTLHMFWLC